MPMPSAYETRSEAFFRLYEGETPQEIQTLLTRWIPKGSRVLELGCGSGRDARFMSGLDAIVEATDGSGPLLKLAEARAQALSLIHIEMCIRDSPCGGALMTWRAGLEAWAHRQWASRGPVAWLLSPLSLVFLAVSRSRRERTVPNRLPVPVVVVGNIYVGGTGKTPVTIALVRELQARGWRPGVISRGFGRR